MSQRNRRMLTTAAPLLLYGVAAFVAWKFFFQKAALPARISSNASGFTDNLGFRQDSAGYTNLY